MLCNFIIFNPIDTSLLLPNWDILNRVAICHDFYITGFHAFGKHGRNLIYSRGERVELDKIIPSNVVACYEGNNIEVRALRGKTVDDIITNKLGTVFILTSGDGEICSWGPNNNCQIGNENTNPVSVAKPFILEIGHDGQKEIVVRMACGPEHTAAITKTGRLFTWGVCNMGSRQRWLGHAGNGYFPQMVITESGREFVQVACTSLATFALTRENKIYSSELNGFIATVQMGQIVDISAGHRHMLALTDDGKVFSWGDNRKKQLGHFSTTADAIIEEPRLVAALKDHQVKSVLAYKNASLVLTADGTALAWGKLRTSSPIPNPRQRQFLGHWNVYTASLTSVPSPVHERFPFSSFAMATSLKPVSTRPVSARYVKVSDWTEVRQIRTGAMDMSMNELINEKNQVAKYRKDV